MWIIGMRLVFRDYMPALFTTGAYCKGDPTDQSPDNPMTNKTDNGGEEVLLGGRRSGKTLELASRLALILGSQSAAARALKALHERQELGEKAQLLFYGKTWYVVPVNQPANRTAERED
jgi:hypothetical protein